MGGRSPWPTRSDRCCDGHPLLLVSITFLFLAAEAWEVLGQLHGVAYLLVLGLFVGIGAAFVLSHLPGDISAAGTLDSWGEVRTLVAGTPARAIALPSSGRPPAIALSPRERVNVALVRAAYRWAVAQESSPVTSDPGG